MSELKKAVSAMSVQALRRMPNYLHYLKELRASGVEYVSAARAAERFALSEIQVRKDFSAISLQKGKPKAGFSVNELIDSIEMYMGFRNDNEAVLAGVGSLGRALLAYSGFEDCGIKIVAAFDANEHKIGTDICGHVVLPTEKISDVCRRMNIHIGIITVPAQSAQLVCDQFVAGGVKAIWNFAQTQLSVPEGILVQNENMAASLAVLSRHLHDVIRDEE